MKIAFLTVSDPLDRRSWSGTPYHMLAALREKAGDVTPIGPLRPPIRQVLRLYRRLRRPIGGTYLPDYSARYARACARTASSRLSRAGPDVIVAAAASAPVAFLETGCPIVYVSDATFAAMEDYHPAARRLSQATRRDGHLLERRSIARSEALVFASDWAAGSALRDYGADPARVHVVPFGANLEDPPGREVLAERDGKDPVRLLIVGRKWERKGGPVAVDALDALTAMGVNAELVVCGMVPPRQALRPRMRVVRFLDKSDARDRAELGRLYRSADVFILPTRNDCFGVVLAEANAYGVPAIAARTGGVPTVIADGVNGRLLPPDATGADYAHVIREVVSDQAGLRELRRRSRAAYESRLSWPVWAAAITDIAASLAEGRGRAA